jgi:hypothetical protein
MPDNADIGATNESTASEVLTDLINALEEIAASGIGMQFEHFQSRIRGTADDGKDGLRRWMATDWLVRTCAPTWLELAAEEETATALRGLPPLHASATPSDEAMLAVSDAVDRATARREQQGDPWEQRLDSTLEALEAALDHPEPSSLDKALRKVISVGDKTVDFKAVREQVLATRHNAERLIAGPASWAVKQVAWDRFDENFDELVLELTVHDLDDVDHLDVVDVMSWSVARDTAWIIRTEQHTLDTFSREVGAVVGSLRSGELDAADLFRTAPDVWMRSLRTTKDPDVEAALQTLAESAIELFERMTDPKLSA